jgi:hypothetical protein
MKFNTKTYKLSKIKNILKKHQFLLFFNIIIQKDQIKNNQKFKKLNFKNYKLHNKLTKKILNFSIYFNYKSLINSLTTFVIPEKDLSLNNLKQLHETILPICVKINNKIYYGTQLKQNLQFTFNKNYINKIKMLKIVSKKILKNFCKN